MNQDVPRSLRDQNMPTWRLTRPKCAASWQGAMVHKVVFPSASLVGKPSMGALMEVCFERLCGLEEPLKRGMRIRKSRRLGLCTTTHVQPLYVRPSYVHWRDVHDVFVVVVFVLYQSWLCVNIIRRGHDRGFQVWRPRPRGGRNVVEAECPNTKTAQNRSIEVSVRTGD